jgi:HAD superfamily hydrolase (TIGR01509 family)
MFALSRTTPSRLCLSPATQQHVTEPALAPSPDARSERGGWAREGGNALQDAKQFAPPRGVADDVHLANPLERLNRLGTGWFGCVFEWEGVLVADASAHHRAAWLALAAELAKPPPPDYLLRRAAGMKSAQAVSEVFCWAREPAAVRSLAARKDALLDASLAGQPATELPGARAFLERLKGHSVPCALVSPAPTSALRRGLAEARLAQYFAATVGAEDVQRGRPDPEAYLYAAQTIGRPPARCLLIGASNASVEAAREGGMRCVAVAQPGAPGYELSAADMVVRRLDGLAFVSLKALFAVEEDAPQTQLEDEEVEEEEEPPPRRGAATFY